MAPSTTPPPGALEPGQRLSLAVERIAALGRSVARHDGFTVLVERGVPGEIVQAEITERHPRYAVARVVAVERPVPERARPICPHFEACGGCDWQHVAYGAQVRHKQQVLAEQLERIGGLQVPANWTVEPAPAPLGYRDKLEFVPAAVDTEDGGTVWRPAFHAPGGAGLTPIDTYCRLAPEVYTRAAQQTLAALARLGLLPTERDASRAVPLLRLAVHGSELPDEGPGVALVLHLRDPASLRRFRAAGDALLELLRGTVPEAIQVAVVAGTRRAGGAYVETLCGPPWLTKRLHGQRFLAPVTGFFQVHPAMAERLAGCVTETIEEALAADVPAGVEPLAPRPVFDLYTGAGLFALALARRGHPVVGAENDALAVQAAREAARLEDLHDCTFVRTDLERRGALARLAGRFGAPAALIVDPPRRGLTGALASALREHGAPLLLYVSCDGGSFARDAARLAPTYRLEKLQGFDLFPQTHHLELAGLFRRVRA